MQRETNPNVGTQISEYQTHAAATVIDAVLKPETWDEHIAYWISQLGSPPVLALLAFVLIGLNHEETAIWTWSFLYLTLILVIPLSYIIVQVRKGNITDIDIQLREQRQTPFLITIGAAAAGCALVLLGGAPFPLTLISVAMLMQILAIFLITLRWKISVHSASAAGITVLILRVLGASAAPIVVTIPLIAWSRIRLRRHTPAQTVGGILLGLIIFFLAVMITS